MTIKRTRYCLSLDGGGVRGAASSQFLLHLEEYLVSKGTCIRDTFDLYAGTSTGGIIALGLAATELTAEEIAKLYNVANGERIMDKSWFDSILKGFQSRPKYDGKGKKEVLEENFKEAKFYSPTTAPCIVPTYSLNERKAVVFNSKDKHKNPYGTKELSVVEVASATSAAPTFFPPELVGDDFLIDGGVICNNPSMVAYTEACHLWGEKTDIRVLSVGTGESTRKLDVDGGVRDWGVYGWMVDGALMNIVMDESMTEYSCYRLFNCNPVDLSEASDQLYIDETNPMIRIMGSKHLLNCEKYVRVNSRLDEETGVNDEMDDVSPDNVEKLKELGTAWWNFFRPQVEKLLEEED
eukprot:Nk52_evm116s221 gene=Nk52_evmTU116s221